MLVAAPPVHVEPDGEPVPHEQGECVQHRGEPALELQQAEVDEPQRQLLVGPGGRVVESRDGGCVAHDGDPIRRRSHGHQTILRLLHHDEEPIQSGEHPFFHAARQRGIADQDVAQARAPRGASRAEHGRVILRHVQDDRDPETARHADAGDGEGQIPAKDHVCVSLPRDLGQPADPARVKERGEHRSAVEPRRRPRPGPQSMDGRLGPRLPDRTSGPVASDEVHAVPCRRERHTDLFGAHVPRVVAIPDLANRERARAGGRRRGAGRWCLRVGGAHAYRHAASAPTTLAGSSGRRPSIQRRYHSSSAAKRHSSSSKSPRRCACARTSGARAP